MRELYDSAYSSRDPSCINSYNVVKGLGLQNARKNHLYSLISIIFELEINNAFIELNREK